MLHQKLSSRIALLLVVFLVKSASCKDEYLLESQQSCQSTKDFFSCAKVRVLRTITNYAVPINDANSTSSFVKLVKIAGEEALEEDPSQEGLTSAARFLNEDSETTKFLKFLQRQANTFLSHQGLSVAIPEGARFVDSETGQELVEVGRKKKLGKKANMIIPILILFKLFKVKVLVALVLAGIFFIKKVILVGALILPSVLHSLKTACKHHLIPTHHVEDHHHDGGLLSGYGGSDYGGGNYYGY